MPSDYSRRSLHPLKSLPLTSLPAVPSYSFFEAVERVDWRDSVDATAIYLAGGPPLRRRLPPDLSLPTSPFHSELFHTLLRQ
jgi:hypothetical protein